MKLTFEQYLSPHFTVGEFFRSGTAIRLGIVNEPDAHPEEGLTNEEVVENLRALCTEVLEPLRRRVGRVIITSGYRCQKLNKAVGGVWNSQHLRGEAADIYVPNQATALRTHSRGTFRRAAGVAGTAWNKAQTVVARNLQAEEVVLRATHWEDRFWRFRSS